MRSRDLCGFVLIAFLACLLGSCGRGGGGGGGGIAGPSSLSLSAEASTLANLSLSAEASIYANVIAVNSGNPLTVEVSILKGVDNASRNGNADFGIRVTVSYVSNQGTVETVDSGRKSIKNETTFVSAIDNRTVAISLSVPLGTAPPPGTDPGFTATAEVLPP